jgi:hypothetical protein
MKAALALLLSVASISCAQERKKDDSKRLSSVTWDLKAHKLIWEVQSGREVDGDFKADSTSRYEISPDDAVMKVLNERRGFTETEAKSLHRLLDTLSLYCAESVVWWDQGQGQKLDESEGPDERRTPHKHRSTPEPKREKVQQPEPKPAPTVRGELVAAASGR